MQIFFSYTITVYFAVSFICYLFCNNELNKLISIKPNHFNAIGFYRDMKVVSFMPILNLFLFVVVVMNYVGGLKTIQNKAK